MASIITLSADCLTRLRAHLFHGNVEQAAFLLVHRQTGRAQDFDVAAVRLLQSDAFAVQERYRMTLCDEVRPAVLRWASSNNACLVEAHSHRGNELASFSSVDIAGLGEWVPHVRWRLQQRPYIALVFTEKSFDALVWAGDDGKPQDTCALRVGNELLAPTNLSYRAFRRRHDGIGSI